MTPVTGREHRLVGVLAAALMVFPTAGQPPGSAVVLFAQDRPLPEVRPAVVALDSSLLTHADSVASSMPALLSLMVVRRGRLALERYYHGASDTTALNIKSVTKSVLSAAVGVAHQQGSLPDLDQTVATILPDLYASPLPRYRSFNTAIRMIETARRQVTIRHLLTMTSGIAWDENGLAMNAFIVNPRPAQFVAELPMAVQPGRDFHYSTGGTHLLAAALAKKVGTRLDQFVRQQVLEPAGISLREWEPDPQGIPMGGSEMFLTSLGLARFGQLYLGQGTIDGVRVLPPGWVEASWQKAVTVTTPSFQKLIPGLDGYGYLWWRRVVAGVTWYCALGFGGQFVLVSPTLDMVVAGGSALDARSPGMERQFAQIFDIADRYLQPAAR